MGHRILVPVDGSASSIRALEHAGKRQRAAAGITILVLNVQSPLAPGRYISYSMTADYYRRASALALKPARAVARRLKLNAMYYVRRGEPGRTIASFAQKENCSEIIMGTRGRGKLATLLLGSVATKVLHLAKVPVTLVR